MILHHEISILCILVIAFQIAQCQPNISNKQEKIAKTAPYMGLQPPPDGYHYELMSEVMKRYSPGSYKIVPIKTIIKQRQTPSKVRRLDSDHVDNDDKPGDGNDDNKGAHGDKDNKEDHGDKDNKEDHGDKNNKEDHGDEDNKEDQGNDSDNHENGDVHDKHDHEKSANKEDHGDDGDNHENGDVHDKHDHEKSANKEDHGDDGDNHENGNHEKEQHGGHHQGHGHDSHKNGEDDDKHEENHGGKDDQDYDPADVLDGNMFEAMEENAKHDGHGDDKRRKKRDFWFKLPFMSSEEHETKTDTVVTTKSVTSTVPPTDSTASTTVTDTTVTATTVATEGSKSDSSGGASDVDAQKVTVVTAVATTSDSGFMDGVQSGVLRIVAIGQDVKTSLVEAAPYLPMVWKVVVFLVPGLSQYELLLLAENVATVTTQALHDYEAGESLSSVLTDVAKKAIWESVLSKRDDGFAIGDYASNIYGTVKTHFVNIPKYFYGDKSASSVTVTLGETTNDIEKLETEVTTINSEIPGTEVTVTENGEKLINTSNKMTEDLKKKIMNMKNHVENSSEGSMSGSDGDDDGDDANDDSDNDADKEINIKTENVEVDKTLFDQILDSSMKLQPDFIQKMSGEELVEYLNNMNILSVVDSKPLFDTLTSKMGIEDRVTQEQRSKLVDILSKITDYFISKGLEAKQYINSIVD